MSRSSRSESRGRKGGGLGSFSLDLPFAAFESDHSCFCMPKGDFGGERDVRVIKSGKWKDGRPSLEMKSTGEIGEQRHDRMCDEWSNDPEAFSR